MTVQSNTLITRSSKCWCSVGWGAAEARDPSAENSLRKNWKQNYFCKAPSITFFQSLESTQIIFFLWLILKRSFSKDLIYLWKTTPSPPYSGITKELNVCTHTHTPKPCSKLRSCELCISIFMIFHLWIYGCKETRLGQEYPKFLLPTISAVYQLLAFSVWSGSN